MNYPAMPRRRKLIVLAATTAISALMLSGCAASPESASPATSSPTVDSNLLEAHELVGLDAPQIIERLDTMPVTERPTDLIASVQSDALILTDGEQRETRLRYVAQLLNALSYKGVLDRGFALVRDEHGQPLHAAANINSGQRL
ncbi:MAG: hypothetical protein J0H70_14985, partial [Microbacterium chocolatum]|nr:hypothetical protein [Microbacterium chocolatum]